MGDGGIVDIERSERDRARYEEESLLRPHPTDCRCKPCIRDEVDPRDC